MKITNVKLDMFNWKSEGWKTGVGTSFGKTQQLGIVTVEIARGELVLTSAPTSRVDPALLVDLVTGPSGEIRVLPDQRVCTRVEGTEPAALFARAHWLLDQLAKAPA